MKKRFVPVSEKERVWIDVETTGLDPLVHEIIELTVRYEPRKGCANPAWHAKIKPEHIETAEPKALEINGYTEEKWAAGGARTAREVFEDFTFRAGLTNVIVAGQNCLTGSSLVTLADGSTMRLNQMVLTKHPGPVLSRNPTTGVLESKPVVGWIKAGTRVWEDWLRIRVRGKGVLALTKDHQVITDRGPVRADQVVLGDRVYTIREQTNPQEEALIVGSLAGDASLQFSSDSSRSPIYTVAHCEAQRSYLDLKAHILRGFNVQCHTEAQNGRGFSTLDGILHHATTKADPRLHAYHDLAYRDGKRHMTQEWLDRMSPAALAIWYADDGETPEDRRASICVTSLGGDPAADMIVAWMCQKGWPAKKYTRPDGHIYIWLAGAGKGKPDNGITAFWEHIAPFMPLCMASKIPTQYRDLADTAKFWDVCHTKSQSWCDEVVEIGPLFLEKGAIKASRYSGHTRRVGQHGETQYCLTVADNHNFFASGLCVSNCRFDMAFIMATFKRLGIEPPDGLDRHLYDLSTLALEHLKPWLNSVSLPQIAKALGVKVEEGRLHGSAYDVELTMKCAAILQRAGWIKRLWWSYIVPRRLATRPKKGTF